MQFYFAIAELCCQQFGGAANRPSSTSFNRSALVGHVPSRALYKNALNPNPQWVTCLSHGNAYEFPSWKWAPPHYDISPPSLVLGIGNFGTLFFGFVP